MKNLLFIIIISAIIGIANYQFVKNFIKNEIGFIKFQFQNKGICYLEGNISRCGWDHIMELYKAEGKENARVFASDLVLVQAINPKKTSYRFDVLENEAPVQPHEIRLNMNDEFIVTQIGWYLLTTTDSKVEDWDRSSIYPHMWTYEPEEMDVKMSYLVNAWNGYLQAQVNKIVYMDKHWLGNHYLRPFHQVKSADGTGAAYVNPLSYMPNQRLYRDGIINLEPYFVLSGATKNDIIASLNYAIPDNLSINFNSSKSSAGAIDNKTLYFKALCLKFSGWLAQNCASYQK